MDEVSELRAEITRLSAELARLSDRLSALEPSPLAGEVAEPEGALPASEASFNWEALIGGQGALWIGSIAVFLALAFGLAYAWATIPPVVRVGGGFLLAGSFLVASALLRGRSQRWFPDGLAGVGLALAYLDAWGGFATHHLFGSQVAFGLMAATTLAGIALAVRFDAMVTGVLATLGGFATPLVIGGEAGTPWPLFGYVAILDLNVLGAALFKRWPALGWLGLWGTTMLAFGWFWGSHPADPWALAGWYSLFFLEFAGAATVYAARKGEELGAHDVLMLVAAACTYAPATYFTLAEPLGAAKAAFPLALGVACGLLALAPTNRTFRSTAAGLGICFATLALPLQLEVDWYAVAFVLEGALLTVLGHLFASRLLIGWGYAVSIAGAVTAIVLMEQGGPGGPVLNPHAMPLALSAVSALVVVLQSGNRVHAAWLAIATLGLILGEELPLWPAPVLALAFFGLTRWRGGPALRGGALFLAILSAAALCLGPVTPLAVCTTLAALLGIHFLGRGDAGPQEQQFQDLMPVGTAAVGVWALSRLIWDTGPVAVTALWLAWGVALLGLGLRFKRGDLRRMALLLLALTAGKVLLVDLATLEPTWRILASGGLGVVLIATSWLYGRLGKEPG